MKNFKNLRLTIYNDNDGGRKVFRMSADVTGPLNYVTFVLLDSELDVFASDLGVINDITHYIQIRGDSCVFFNFSWPGNESGEQNVPYYSANFPIFVRKIFKRMANTIWNLGESGKEYCIEIPNSKLEKWDRLYGCGTGQIKIVMDDKSQQFMEEKLSEPGSNLLERFNQLKTIAQNSTSRFWHTAELRISKDLDGFFFSVPGLHGGIINHGKDKPDWSIHT